MPTEILMARPERRDQAGDPDRLSLLESPLFSTGQLLTDDDLTALVQWTRKKLQLARYRLGWGVVCGLGLSADLKNEGGVVLGPGYAIDASGEDILVARETSVSLEECLKSQTSWKELSPDGGDSEQTVFGGFSTTEVVAVDLTLHFREDRVSPRATLSRGEQRVTAREYTRARESYSVVCSIGAKDTNAAAAEAKSWTQGYDRCLDVVRSYLKEAERATKQEIHHWLRSWVTKHPPYQFRFVADWVEGQSRDSWTQRDAVQVLFWLVQDARNAFLHRACVNPSENQEVPVGRVWIRKIPRPVGKTEWRLVAIDSQPPHQRSIQSSNWPAAEGQVNVGGAIWRPTGDATSSMRKLGVSVVDAEEFSVPDSARELETKLQHGVQVNWDTIGKLQWFDAGALGLRSVGLSRKD